MDSSTTRKELEQRLGGPQVIAKKTGARCFERFTINQIAKIFRENNTEYNQTERISLVSSFFISLLISGSYASIDTGDGAGMNAMNLETKEWEEEILEYAAPPKNILAEKLGKIQPSHAVAGKISSYFCKKYNFNKECIIINGSGDNPCTLAGLKLSVGDIAISLGTSSVLFGPLTHPVPSHRLGTILCDPVHPLGYMGMLVYKNGALTREEIRDKHADKKWAKFGELLRLSPPGNSGKIGFFFSEYGNLSAHSRNLSIR